MPSARLQDLIDSLESEIERLESENAALNAEFRFVEHDLNALQQWMDDLGIPNPERLTVGEELEIRSKLGGWS